MPEKACHAGVAGARSGPSPRSGTESPQTEEVDGQGRCAAHSQVCNYLTDSWSELESMSGKSGGENQVLDVRMPVDYEVFVRRHRVKAEFSSQNASLSIAGSASQTRQQLGSSLENRPDFVRRWLWLPGVGIDGRRAST